MSAVVLRARADIRARPLSLVFVTIMVGVIGAVAIACYAGARRSDSAFARYRAATGEPDAVVLSCPKGSPTPPVDLERVAALPQVASFFVAANGQTNVTDVDGHPLLASGKNFEVSVIAARNAADAAKVRFKLMAGRLPTAPDEVAVSWGTTQTAPRPSVGDTIELQMVAASAAAPGAPQTGPPASVRYRVRVVGEVLTPGGLVGDKTDLWAGPSFVPAHKDAIFCAAGVYHLHRGFADMDAFLSGIYAFSPHAALEDFSSEALFVARTTHLNAIVLRLMALLATIAGIIVLGQSLVRRTALGMSDTPILRALGMTRRQIVWAAAISAFVVAAVGSAIAVGGAIAASTLFPTGVARIAEPSPGVRIDLPAVGLGVLVIVTTTILSVVIPARWLATARGGPGGAVEYRGAERRSVIAGAIARLPLPVTAGAGARLALEPGHGRTATPVRSAVVGLTLAVAGMVAAFGFAASMDHFGSTPRLWGVNFQFGAGQPFAGDRFQALAVPVIRRDAQVADLVGANIQQYVSLSGPSGVTQEAVWALQNLKGRPVTTTLLAGRWPETPNEIAIGHEALSTLGLGVGDTVSVTVANTTRTMRIVGQPVFPDFGFGPGLGRGVGMTLDGLRVFYPTATQNLVLGNFTAGADPAVVLGRLNREVLDRLGAQASPDQARSRGTTVTGTLRSRTLPLQLSILFAFAALATLVHVLLTSVRRRRRDLAILQTLGFRRGQVTATVIWQALTLSGLALAIGVPVGILIGRLGWSAFADRLGVVSEPVIAPIALLVIPATLAVALVVSLGPGLVARHVRPADVLKAE